MSWPTVSVGREVEIAAAHHLPDYAGSCRHQHGHNFRIVAEASGPVDDGGMVIDLRDLKAALACIEGDLDHGDLNALLPGGFQPPTVENLAAYVLAELRGTHALPVTSVTVWENPRQYARAEVPA